MHFKNSTTKGPQHIPIAKANLEVFKLLEEAAAFVSTSKAGGVHTLFHGAMDGNTYKAAYFSMVGAKVLSWGGVKWCANMGRHIFSTTYRDWLARPGITLEVPTQRQMEMAATVMTLNSSTAWDSAYDDSFLARGMISTLETWPHFVKFVKGQHDLKMSEKAWDPLSTALEELEITE